MPKPRPWRDDDDDDYPRRRTRRRSGGVPAWAWAVGGVAVVVVVGLGLFFALKDRKGQGDGPPRGWVRRSPEGTKLTFDLPAEPVMDGGGVGDTKDFGDRMYVCQQIRDSRERPVVFSAIVSFHEAHDKLMPNVALANLAKQKLAVGAGDRFQKLVKQYQIGGRDALVYSSAAAEKVALMVFEPGKTYIFEVFGPGITEDDADVKRFFDSVRFAD